MSLPPMWGPPPVPPPRVFKVEALRTRIPLIQMCVDYQQRADARSNYLSPEEARRLAALLLEAADRADILDPDKQEQP